MYVIAVTRGVQVQLPREVAFLTGAPGAGKGSNLALIQHLLGAGSTLGLSTELGKHREASRHMREGGLVPEHLVTQTLFDSLFERKHSADGRLVIDGFPRSAWQVSSHSHSFL